MAVTQMNATRTPSNSPRNSRLKLSTASVKEASRAMAMKKERYAIIAAGTSLSGRPSKTFVCG